MGSFSSAALRTTLVLGGARSGKSRYAEALVERQSAARVYLATAEAGDAEMEARIRRHRARRGPGWCTVEAPLELARAIEAEARRERAVLVDCLTLWLANLMGAARDVERETEILVACLGRVAGPVVLVSNEVGYGIVPDNEAARRFRDHAGLLHQRVAAVAGTVVLVAAGLPLALKGVALPLAPSLSDEPGSDAPASDAPVSDEPASDEPAPTEPAIDPRAERRA